MKRYQIYQLLAILFIFIIVQSAVLTQDQPIEEIKTQASAVTITIAILIFFFFQKRKSVRWE